MIDRSESTASLINQAIDKYQKLLLDLCEFLNPEAHRNHRENQPDKTWLSGFLSSCYYINLHLNMRLNHPKPSQLGKLCSNYEDAIKLYQDISNETGHYQEVVNKIKKSLQRFNPPHSVILDMIDLLVSKIKLKIHLYELDPEEPEFAWQNISEMVEKLFYEIGLKLSNNQPLPQYIADMAGFSTAVEDAVNEIEDNHLSFLPVTNQQLTQNLIKPIEGKAFLQIQDNRLLLLLSKQNTTEQDAIDLFKAAVLKHQNSPSLSLESDLEYKLWRFKPEMVATKMFTAVVCPYVSVLHNFAPAPEQVLLPKKYKINHQIINREKTPDIDIDSEHNMLPEYSFVVNPQDDWFESGIELDFWVVVIDDCYLEKSLPAFQIIRLI